jgi:hypothetical protein
MSSDTFCCERNISVGAINPIIVVCDLLLSMKFKDQEKNNTKNKKVSYL